MVSISVPMMFTRLNFTTSFSEMTKYYTLTDKNSSENFFEISVWCWKFCPTTNFVRRKFCPSKTLSNISIQKSSKNREKLSKFGLGVENFDRREFCLKFQYKSQEKIGQKCRNLVLVSKILSDEIFCSMKVLSDGNFVR